MVNPMAIARAKARGVYPFVCFIENYTWKWPSLYFENRSTPAFCLFCSWALFCSLAAIDANLKQKSGHDSRERTPNVTLSRRKNDGGCIPKRMFFIRKIQKHAVNLNKSGTYAAKA
jgi:hypothetical protein